MSLQITYISLDINSELDELDREEFYRLKKVTTIDPNMCQTGVN